MKEDIERVAQLFKERTKGLSQGDSLAHFEQQKEQYEKEYSQFLTHYEKKSCYLCGKPLKTISTSKPCLHWLLRECKFKKKDFPKITEHFDFYNISSYLRWVANAEAGSRNINNLKEESSERKVFEVTIKWKDIEWTLDCSKNDLAGHEGSKTDFPHWHFQMRVGGNQFINFNDFHIRFSKDDQLKIALESDEDSGFIHSFGPGGEGMQEHMDRMAEDPDKFISNAISTSNPDEGSVHMQSIITGPEGGISSEKINEAMAMARTTGKTLAHCFREVLGEEKGVSISTVASPAESVPEIAKRTERKRR
ncbi:hypothetical protein PVK63_03970 [Aliivibrio sp. S2TY2]|uniref:hypothetical protein n=1 Tax=unclassified Aliivibrio TaxID=2645654 RepID=UPI0023783481|nr:MULTISPECIES: hypothetical protein [unclassified Aliivibrio]MDD9174017.1 hypothetical protein [Aliivibrio sp. S3TY1]MDD9191094.1 hypothetical protein [Aliivibrio sp. S2TY2]